MFLQVSVCLSTGGHAWLPGGVRGCGGVCMVARGGMHGCWGEGVCMAKGGVHGEEGGMHGKGGACMVKWGVHGKGGMCSERGVCVGYDEIRSMSGWYASYWNAFLLTETLLDRMGVQTILPIKVSVTIDTILNFDGDFGRHRNSHVTCKQTFISFVYRNQEICSATLRILVIGMLNFRICR